MSTFCLLFSFLCVIYSNWRSGGGRVNRGRGGRGRGGRGRGGFQKTPVPTADELDAELDAYKGVSLCKIAVCTLDNRIATCFSTIIRAITDSLELCCSF